MCIICEFLICVCVREIVYVCVCSVCFRATGWMLEDVGTMPKVYMKSFRRESEKDCPLDS
jgi:5-methylcytosine-specific restriction endonuclease McrA